MLPSVLNVRLISVDPMLNIRWSRNVVDLLRVTIHHIVYDEPNKWRRKH